MNVAPLIARLLLPARRAVRRPDLAVVRPGRRAARRAVWWFVVAALGLQVASYLAIDVVWTQIRDPEYARRVGRLKERMAEHPDRPVVLVVGSSRASMGLRPEAWEECRPARAGHPDPLLFNMSLVGSGPLMELMCLRRVYADGVRPDAVVLEYWPPFLREDGPYFEPDRIDHARLSDRDRPLVREYFGDPTGTERHMLRDRLYALSETRHRLVAQVLPRWQPWDKRIEMAWGTLDGWGWLAGLEEKYPPDPKARNVRLTHCEKIYRGQFAGYTIHELAKRALRETIALARAHGTKVAFAYLPEAAEFRSWMPPAVEQAAQDYLHHLCRELDIPLIDARLWMDDGYLVDGFHLSRQGAAEFTRKFGPAVAATFPDLRRGP